ncbi:MAG: HAD family phosphatase [Anaerolineaceae bacterium]|nr:HAD family phosphatase [Anaerolineaceae bacterium]
MEKISILWDLDGTIIDSVDLYYEAYRAVFKKYDLGPLNAAETEYRSKYFGRAVEVFLRDHVSGPISDDLMAAMKWDYLQAANEHLMSSPDGGIRLIPGVDRVINAFFEKGYLMAIASTSWLPTVVHSLEKVGLLEKFANISSGFLLPSKPAPDVFRLAAALNNVLAERCVVFEDSLAGMRGAKAAGMKCVGIGTSVELSQMADADIRLNSYSELNIEDVERLFR